MSVSRGSSIGTPIRWAAGHDREEQDGVVRAGDVGSFIDFDGPDSREVVVSFSAVGAFVAPVEDVELVEGT